MTKQEFLARLREGLRGLPEADIEERLTFYGEMLDDRMEIDRAESATGSVDVPRTTRGGTYVVTSGTGDIEITIK